MDGVGVSFLSIDKSALEMPLKKYLIPNDLLNDSSHKIGLGECRNLPAAPMQPALDEQRVTPRFILTL